MSCHLSRNAVAAMGNLVVFVQIDESGFEVGKFLLIHYRIVTNNDLVARLGLMRGSPIDRYDPRTIFGTDGIGYKSLAIIDVIDMDLFIFMDTGSIQQLAVDGTRALILKLGMSHPGTVEFGFQKCVLHLTLDHPELEYEGSCA